MLLLWHGGDRHPSFTTSAKPHHPPQLLVHPPIRVPVQPRRQCVFSKRSPDEQWRLQRAHACSTSPRSMCVCVCFMRMHHHGERSEQVDVEIASKHHMGSQGGWAPTRSGRAPPWTRSRRAPPWTHNQLMTHNPTPHPNPQPPHATPQTQIPAYCI